MKKKIITILSKKKHLSFYKNNIGILVVSRERESHVLFSALLSSAISVKKKLGVAVLSIRKESHYLNLIYKSLGISNFINLKEKRFKIKDYFKIISFFIKSIYRLKKSGFEWFIPKFKIEKIYCGDLIYDHYIRYNLLFLKRKPTIKFYLHLLVSIINFYRIIKLIKNQKFKYIISYGGAYSNYSGLTKRIASELKIKVIWVDINMSGQLRLHNSFRLKRIKGYKQRSGYLNNDFFLNKNLIYNFTKNLSQKKMNLFFKSRAIGKASTLRTNRTDILNSIKNSRNFIYTKKILFNKIFQNYSERKLILIAPHAFSDAPHLDKILIFNDFYDHLYKTLTYISKNNLNKVCWLVRPHPSSEHYGEKNITENLLEKFNLDYVKTSPKNISSKNIIDICDGVVTCTGTISLEFAIKGKFSINAGYGAYSKFGITNDCSNKKEYFNYLKKIEKIEPLSKHQIKLAKKIFFFLENFDPGKKLSGSSLINYINPFHNRKFHNNVDDNNIFNEKVARLINKTTISKDSFFKSLKNNI
jgi:hypothetical protein